MSQKVVFNKIVSWESLLPAIVNGFQMASIISDMKIFALCASRNLNDGTIPQPDPRKVTANIVFGYAT